MRALIFDPFCGASGDMIMATLLDLGADASVVVEAVESVDCSLDIRTDVKGHIEATRAVVSSDGRFKSLDEGRFILEASTLAGPALEKALGALEILAEAEGRVHGVPRTQARFHEIGALDALADIAGCCAALESLAPEVVLSLPPSVGGGTVRSAHGLIPVPAPATLEVLRIRDMPWQGGPLDQELLTPTGASILAIAVDRFVDLLPRQRSQAVGYGAGSRDLEIPNVLRGSIADVDAHAARDRVVLLETNLDDVTGEVLGNLIDLLMEDGALDVTIIPALMKKGRSGNVVSVVCREEDQDRLTMRMMTETGSLGVRTIPTVHRLVAKRDSECVEVEIGGALYKAEVKVSRLGEELLNIKPEFEDCRRIAMETGLPLRSIMRLVGEVGWRSQR